MDPLVTSIRSSMNNSPSASAGLTISWRSAEWSTNRIATGLPTPSPAVNCRPDAHSTSSTPLRTTRFRKASRSHAIPLFSCTKREVRYGASVYSLFPKRPRSAPRVLFSHHASRGTAAAATSPTLCRRLTIIGANNWKIASETTQFKDERSGFDHAQRSAVRSCQASEVISELARLPAVQPARR